MILHRMNIYAIRARLYKSSQSASLLSRAVPKGPECLFAKVGAWYERALALSKRARARARHERQKAIEQGKPGNVEVNRKTDIARARARERKSAQARARQRQTISSLFIGIMRRTASVLSRL